MAIDKSKEVTKYVDENLYSNEITN